VPMKIKEFSSLHMADSDEFLYQKLNFIFDNSLPKISYNE
jgi:hypothetical protein